MALTFLHTAEVHVATFQALVEAQDASIQVKHHVKPSLLEQARQLGVNNPTVIKAVENEIAKLTNQGANPVVCTCSTIGNIVESISKKDISYQRIDRAMANAAVAFSTDTKAAKIAIVAALKSTLEPTKNLIESSATTKAKLAEISLHYVKDAWQHFEAGDNESYWETIAMHIQQLPKDIDVIVLAQASMANAISYCTNLETPILSSPSLGVQAALNILKDTEKI